MWCDEERELISEYIKFAIHNSIDIFPVIYEYDDFSILEGVNKAAIRLPIPESFEGNSNSDIIKQFSKLSKVDEKILIFDAGVVEPKNANIILESYRQLISSNRDILATFSKVVICLTSFPEILNVEAGENAIYPRNDFAIFKYILKNFKELEPRINFSYSDYGVTKFTDSEMDFSFLKYGILPKIKYTTDKEYVVLKGKKDHAKGIFLRSYFDMAKEIIKSSYFYGKDYSFGDNEIYKRASDLTNKPGGSTNWVTYAANHHLTVVLEQTSSLS